LLTDQLVTNEIKLVGKVSSQSPLRYTPAGFPVKEFTLAVNQEFLETANVGYFEVILTGELAEVSTKLIRIGATLNLLGRVWNRNYKNKEGLAVKEVKVIATALTPHTGVVSP